MASDPRSYATVDVPLFDAGQVPAGTRDQRTVGERLIDIDYLARQLLMDVTGDQAAGLIRGWPAVVQAAGHLWTRLPGRRQGVDDRDRPMERLVEHAGTAEKSLDLGRWPGRGAADRRLLHIAEGLREVEALVDRYGAELPLHRIDVFRDLEAARSRVMHALYITTHAVSVGLHAHGRDLYDAARDAGKPVPTTTGASPYAIPPTTEWIGRLAACENAGRAYLRGASGRLSDGVGGEARVPGEDPDRLARALAGWDIQSHRTILADPSAAHLLLVNRTQALIAGAGLVLVEAACARGIIEPSQRLTAAIAESGRSWSNLAGRWGDLALPDAHIDPALIRAAAEVRASLRELTHDTATVATPHVIATRPGLDLAIRATLRAFETAAEMAYVIAEKAHNPDLAGPARALSQRAHNDIEAGMATPHPTGDFVWVSPNDILAQRIIPIPQPVAETLRSASTATVAANRAAAAVSALYASRMIRTADPHRYESPAGQIGGSFSRTSRSSGSPLRRGEGRGRPR